MMTGRVCPKCGGGFGVIDSRPSNEAGVRVRRVIVCLSCGERYITHETIVGAADGFNDSGQGKAVEFLRQVEQAMHSIYGDRRATISPSRLGHGVPVCRIKDTEKPEAAE